MTGLLCIFLGFLFTVIGISTTHKYPGDRIRINQKSVDSLNSDLIAGGSLVLLLLLLLVRTRSGLGATVVATALGNVLSLDVDADGARGLLAGTADHISLEVESNLDVEDATDSASLLVLANAALANAAVRLGLNLQFDIKINEAGLQFGSTGASLAKNINIDVLVAAGATVLLTISLSHGSSVYIKARIFPDFPESLLKLKLKAKNNRRDLPPPYFVLHLTTMRIHHIAKDGNCMFNSCAYLLSADCRRSPRKPCQCQLRKEISQVVLNFPQMLINGQTVDEWVKFNGYSSRQDYAQKISKNGVWGDGLCLAIIAMLYSRSICIYESSSESSSGCPNHDFKLMTEYFPELGKPLRLLYRNSHYDALFD